MYLIIILHGGLLSIGTISEQRGNKMGWKNHEEDPMEQMRRAFLSEIKGLKNKIELLQKQIQEEVKEKYSLYKRIKELTK